MVAWLNFVRGVKMVLRFDRPGGSIHLIDQKRDGAQRALWSGGRTRPWNFCSIARLDASPSFSSVSVCTWGF